jgi:hypothetical protein
LGDVVKFLADDEGLIERNSITHMTLTLGLCSPVLCSAVRISHSPDILRRVMPLHEQQI